MSWLLVLCFTLVSAKQLCDEDTSFYKTPGELVFIGMIDAHSGENCSKLNPTGMQMAESMVSAVEAIQDNNFLQGLKLGLTLYDVCTNQESMQKPIISALIDIACEQNFLLGNIMDKNTYSKSVKNLTSTLSVPVMALANQMSSKLRARLLAKLMYDLGWTPIHYLITNNGKGDSEFVEAATLFGICINYSISLNEIGSMDPESTALVMANFSEIKSSLMHIPNIKLNILLMPTDGIYEVIPVPKNIWLLIFLPTTVDFHAPLYNMTGEITDTDIAGLTKSKSSLNQLQTVANMVRLVLLAKSHLQEHCGKVIVCPELPKLSVNQTLEAIFLNGIESILPALKVLKIDVEEFEMGVLLEQSKTLSKVGTIHIAGFEWVIGIDGNITRGKTLTCNEEKNQPEIDCSACYNYNMLYTFSTESRPMVVLRDEAWVAALLSVSAVGVVSCLAIAIFILIRICKKDMLEGNPGFSFLMLMSMVFMYCGILPFSFKVVDNHHYYKGIICGFKLIGTSLSYALVYSVMLARSLMLASCDEDGGFMSHVNGYLQTVLCFFIAAVQVALTLQFWAMNWILTDQEKCSSITQGPVFLYLLGYDMFLLFLLICLSPFIMRSKRNYQEGGYFAASTLFLLVVWVSWSCGYMLFPAYADIFVCYGLVATATVILVTIFIPRTYLMMTGIVRDHIVSTLPNLGHTSSTSIVDVNYHSTQALYDSVVAQGQVNPNYYAERPTTPSTSKMDDRVNDGNPYERYDRSPSPLHVTRF